ncbi:MAG: YigZ family protein [Marinobacter sp.]|nr:YigZ family protein [Marinobacter sp.]
MSKDYPIPAGFLERELEVKKSRFIARVLPVSDREQVKQAVAEARQAYPDARHVCWGYQIGRPGAAAEAGMSDDGEPSGTAGKPILSVIQHKDMGDVAVIVVRYFGGIKLGAGGLVRAYAGAAELVLSAVERRIAQAMSVWRLSLAFSQEQPLRHWCDQMQGEVLQVDYGVGVVAQVAVPVAAVPDFQAFCDAQRMDYSVVSN